MLIPVLAHLVLFDLENEYITDRPSIFERWILVQHRPSYREMVMLDKAWIYSRMGWKGDQGM
ncbi:Glutathione S-transferase TCHQD, partial [Mucuna pruriens]